MTLQIRIANGEVIRWEYVPKPASSPPTYREPIRFDPEYHTLMARVRRIFTSGRDR